MTYLRFFPDYKGDISGLIRSWPLASPLRLVCMPCCVMFDICYNIFVMLA